MSPTGVTIAAAAARAASEALAAKAGIGRPSAEALADIPSERLRALVPNPLGGGLLALGRDLDGGIPNIGPTVDGDLIERPTIESLAAGAGSDTPLVIGGMDDEMSAVVDELPRLVTLTPLRLVLDVLGLRGERRRAYLAANPAVAARGHGAIIGRFVSDVTLRRDVMRVAQARGEAAAPTWTYAFSWVSPVTHWAMHCLDVPFFFDVLGAEGVARVAGSTPPASLARQYHGAAVSLAHDHRVDWTAWAPGGVSRVFDGSDGLVESRDAYAGVMPLLDAHPDPARAPVAE